MAIKVSRPDGNEPQALASSAYSRCACVFRPPRSGSAGLVSYACPISAALTSPRCSRQPADFSRPNTPGEAWSKPSIRSVEACRPFLRVSQFPGQSHRCDRSSRSPTSRRETRPRPLSSGWRPLAGFPGWPRLPGIAKTREPVVIDRRGRDPRAVLHGASAIQAAVWIVATGRGTRPRPYRGLLHRDLKPSNILLTEDGTPMLLDFNLCRRATPRSPRAMGEDQRTLIGGTLPYMSPEHLDAFDPTARRLGRRR